MESSGFNISADELAARRSSSTQIIYESRNGYCRIYATDFNGRRIALKALKPEYADSDVHINLLRKEYEIGHSLYHPYIASTIGFRSFPGIGPAIVMELVDGLTLRDYIDSKGPLPQKEAMAIVEELCDALEYLHSHQLIHRDLKPSNIMLTHAGHHVKLIDFGLSDGTAFTDFKYAGGTRHYSAPEQLAKGTDSDPRADIYSLGVIMQEICPKGSAGYRNVSRQCTMERPDDRPSSASSVIPLIGHRDKIRRLWLSGIAAVAVVTLIGTAAIFFTGRRSETAAPANITAHAVTDTASTAKPVPPVADTPGVIIPAMDAPIIPADAPAPADGGGQAATDTDAPSDRELTLNEASIKCQEIIVRRYADHLKLIDTLTTHRSSELASCGHWKYLTKGDFNKWIADKGVTVASPAYEIYTSMAQKAINDYEERNRYDELLHWQKASYPQVAKGFSKDLGDGRIYTFTIQEDGTYMEEYTDVRARREREQVERDLERIRNGEIPF